MGSPVSTGSTHSAAGHSRAANPDAMLLCRWLPQPQPFGAFSGNNDGVHDGDRQGLVNLWSTGGVVHPGQYVGPPRGGLATGPDPTYSVAMPLGGYLNIDSGVLTAWTQRPHARPILRADGEVFDAEAFGIANPYFLAQYRELSHAQCRRNIAVARRQRLATAQLESASSTSPVDPRDEADSAAEAAMELIAAARAPQVCSCRTDEKTAVGPLKSQAVPSALLQRPAALTIMAGVGSPDDAIDVVWRLTAELADATTAALVRAAEDLAREASGNLATLPVGPLTEESVAMVAAQALRWHGYEVLERLPSWTLGWIFVAAPLLQRLRSKVGTSLEATQEQADVCRIERANHMFRVRSAAKAALHATSQWASDPVVDLRPRVPWPRFSPSAESRTLYQNALGDLQP